MKLTIHDNIWASVDEGDWGDVDRALRYRVKGAQFAQAYQRGWWDGYKNMTHRLDGHLLFPVGLLPYLLEQPCAQGAEVQDLRTPPAALEAGFGTKQRVTLAPEQEAAVQAALDAGRGIIKAPTGFGKGRIIGETLRRLNVSTLVICDKRDLLYGLEKEIGECIETKVGLLGDSKMDIRPVTVATVQTLAKGLNDPNVSHLWKDWLTAFHAVLVDEAHHAESESMELVLKNLPNAYYRIGFSATAFKSFTGKTVDRSTFLKVQAWLGPIITNLTLSDGIDAGRIVPADIYMIEDCTWSGTTINWKEEYQAGIVNNDARNSVVVHLARTMKDDQTVILVDRVDHGAYLAQVLNCPFIHGETNSKTRKFLYERFRRGDEKLLVIGKLGNEALDLPNLTVLILASGGNAPHVTIQKVGRSMRTSTGKERATVFDFWDYGKYITSHSRRRYRTYSKEPAYTVNLIPRRTIMPKNGEQGE